LVLGADDTGQRMDSVAIVRRRRNPAIQIHPFLASNLTEDEYTDLVEEQGVDALHPTSRGVTQAQ
jgi:hypothetical protein